MFIKTFNFWDHKIFYFQITTECSFSNELNEKKMNFEFFFLTNFHKNLFF